MDEITALVIQAATKESDAFFASLVDLQCDHSASSPSGLWANGGKHRPETATDASGKPFSVCFRCGLVISRGEIHQVGGSDGNS
jgi:hypothetical protein